MAISSTAYVHLFDRCWPSSIGSVQRSATGGSSIARSAVLLVTVLALLFGSISAHAFELEVGHWAGHSEHAEGAATPACTVSLHNGDEAYLLLRLDESRHMTLGVSDITWPGNAPRTVDLIVMVDHALINTRDAVLVTTSFLHATVLSPGQAMDLIGRGQKLLVTDGTTNAAFQLQHGGEAMRFLANCVNAKITRQTTGTPNSRG